MGVIIFILMCSTLVVLDLAICKVYCKRQTARFGKENDSSGTKSTVIEKKKTRSKAISGLLRYNLFLVSYFPSHLVRKYFYTKICGAKISNTAVIHYGVEIRAPWRLSIGAGTIIGDKAILDARSGLIIGENVNLSTEAWIWTLQHDIQSNSFSSSGTGKSVTIKDRAWISSRTTILPGVTIGEGCVVATGAVVTKNCDDFSVMGGIPAKKIGERTRSIDYSFHGEHDWFI